MIGKRSTRVERQAELACDPATSEGVILETTRYPELIASIEPAGLPALLPKKLVRMALESCFPKLLADFADEAECRFRGP